GKSRGKELVAEEDDEPETHTESRFTAILSIVETVLASHAPTYLLTFDRHKLIDYLQESSEPDKDNSQPDSEIACSPGFWRASIRGKNPLPFLLIRIKPTTATIYRL